MRPWAAPMRTMPKYILKKHTRKETFLLKELCHQGRSEQSLWYGPKSKLAPLKKKIGPSKFFCRLSGKNCALVPLNGAPTLPFFRGGGCKRWYFGQICAPVTTPLRAAAPLAPPCYGPVCHHKFYILKKHTRKETFLLKELLHHKVLHSEGKRVELCVK